MKTAVKTHKKRGPKPWRLTEKRLEKIFKGAKKGLSEEQIAKLVGISQKTFQVYKKKYSQIPRELEKGRDQRGILPEDVQRVEGALLQRCLGCEYDEVTTETRLAYGRKHNVTKTITKRVQPSDTAIIFFLCNTAGDKWRSLYEKDREAPEDIQATLDKLADSIIKGDSSNGEKVREAEAQARP